MSYYRWPELDAVSCRSAQQVLTALYFGGGFRMQIDGGNAGARDLPQLYMERPNQRMLRLREELQRSGLEVMLAGGEGALPDISGGCDELTRAWLRLIRPRSYEQLAHHLARHLDWYLDPQRVEKGGPLAYGLIAGLSICAAILAASCLMILGQPGIGIYILLLVSAGALLWALVASMPNPQELMENRYELYLFLKAAYSDPPEGPSAEQPALEQPIRSAELEGSEAQHSPQARGGQPRAATTGQGP
ncbi:hypothetical protein IT575_03030 [bacterium]|nr:hypothetical protein [bacterium]